MTFPVPSAASVPAPFRRNFIHLYLEVVWFGILSGSAVNFLNVYATRLGASGQQLGLLTAAPALVSLLLSIPFGYWLRGRRMDRAVFWTALLYRIGYLLWVPLPFLLGDQGQIWALIGITFLMGIPLTGLVTGFNILFAGAVPPEWRAQVVGLRNVLQSLTFILASFGCGLLLDHLPFPLGYQLVFLIGALGGAMSTLHLFFVRVPPPRAAPAVPRESRAREVLRPDIWRSPFARVLLLMAGFHLTQYLPQPLFALQYVHGIGLSDAEIGLGTALFYLTVLAGSTQLRRLVHRSGHHQVTGWGAMGLALYPAGLALSHTPAQFFLVSTLGGLIWALVGGAYANYLLERIPPADLPAHIAWYNLVLNASILVGTLAGSLLGGVIGTAAALLLIAVLRFGSGWALLKWGR